MSDVQTAPRQTPQPFTEQELTPEQEQIAHSQPPQSQPKKRSAKPIGIIITAIIVCLVLAGGAVYATMHKKAKPATTSQVTSQQAETATKDSTTNPASDAGDVDSAITQTNDLQDQGQDISSDLTDQSLGL